MGLLAALSILTDDEVSLVSSRVCKHSQANFEIVKSHADRPASSTRIDDQGGSKGEGAVGGTAQKDKRENDESFDISHDVINRH